MIKLREEIPDIPQLDQISIEEVDAVLAHGGIVKGTNWADHCKEIENKDRNQQVRMDMNQPHYYSKNDTGVSLWHEDTFGTDTYTEKAKQDFEKLFEDASIKGMNTDLINVNQEDLESLGTAIANNAKAFISETGKGDNPDYRFSRFIVPISGLGLNFLRYTVKQLGEHDKAGLDELGVVLSCDWDRENFDKMIINARELSGYPQSLLRTAFSKMRKLIEDHNLNPRWTPPLVTAHVLKHVRIGKRGSKCFLVVAYDGQSAVIPLDDDQLLQPLGSQANRKLKQDVANILGIPLPNGKNQSLFSVSCASVLNKISLTSIIRLVPLEQAPHVLLYSELSMKPTLLDKPGFINPGIQIGPVAVFDKHTGRTELGRYFMDEHVLRYNLFSDLRMDPGKVTADCIPTGTINQKPSDILRALVPQLDDCGHKIGFDAIVNAVITLAVVGPSLRPGRIKNMLDREKPIVAITPTESTAETTTNNGKTGCGILIGSAIVGRQMSEDVVSMSSSAPAQRSAAKTLDEFGTAVIGEMQIPKSPDHPFSARSMQGMATGDRGSSPGKVLENNVELRLRFPLIIVMKVASMPPDLYNRSIPIRIGLISDATRLDGKALAGS